VKEPPRADSSRRFEFKAPSDVKRYEIADVEQGQSVSAALAKNHGPGFFIEARFFTP
jgi:hypothetical protein